MHAHNRMLSVALSEVFAKGGKGGIDLAQKVIRQTEEKPREFPSAL